MSTRKRQYDESFVPETANGVNKRRRQTYSSPSYLPTPRPSKCLPKQEAGDPLTKKKSFKRIAELPPPLIPSHPLIPGLSTRFSIANPASSSSVPASKSAARKCATDDCEGNTAPLPKKTKLSLVTRRKKRVATSPPRKVKRLPLREELEVLRAALPPKIGSYLDPPRDDKGPIPDEGKTLGEFLRWKTMYNDELVERIVDEQHVVCKGCGSSFALCHDTAYNWFKWGRHRKCCLRQSGVDPDEARVRAPAPAPVLLDQLLPRRTGRLEVDMLFPKTKGGPYYRHRWTYFVPRPGQLRPDDPEGAPRAPGSSTLSARRSMNSSSSLSRHSFFKPDPSPSCERELHLSDRRRLGSVEMLLEAAEFMYRANALCNCYLSGSSRPPAPFQIPYNLTVPFLSMIPRKPRSKNSLADGNLPSNCRRSDPDFSESMSSSSRSKNPRKRSRVSDEEACPAPPTKRVSNRRAPSIADPSLAAKRAAPRRSGRKIGRSAKKDVPESADPDPDVIVIDDDGYPYVAYDDAPHLHPPPRRHKPNEPNQPAEKIKGCSIKPCWTPTQKRRCELLQNDPAVEAIGWKKVRKWMQAVRCRLCGEAQVLRDLTKGCFNLEHWWRHLRVRHGIKREEEIQDKGEEKYKTLPIKDHVCVGACSTCGEGGTPVSTHPNTRHTTPRVTVESSDLSSLSNVNSAPDSPRKPIPEPRPSMSRVEHPSQGLSPRAGPSNTNSPPPTSGLYTLENARPQYESDGTLTSFPTSACRDLPPPVPRSWAEFIDPNLFLTPLNFRPIPQRPSTDNNLSIPTPQRRHTRPLPPASPSPSPRLPPIRTAEVVARGEPDTIDAAHALLFLNRGPPARTLELMSTGAKSPPATHARPSFRSTIESVPPLTQLPTAASAFQPPSVRPIPDGPPSTATAPGLSNYRWPPVNTVPRGAPCPPPVITASWQCEESNIEEEGHIADLQRDVRTKDTNPRKNRIMASNSILMATPAIRLHCSPVPDWGDCSDDREMTNSLAESISPQARRCDGEREGANEPGPLQQPEWAFIKQEESEPDLDEDDDSDMVDQLIDDH